MKKLLGISLIAMMSVTAANADIASKAYVDAETTRASTAETNIGTRIDNLDYTYNRNAETDGHVVTAVSEDGGVIAVTMAQGAITDVDVNASADIASSKIKLTGYQLANAAADISANDTLDVALGKLQKQIDVSDSGVASLNLSKTGDDSGTTIVKWVQQDAGLVTAGEGQIVDAEVASNADIASSKIKLTGYQLANAAADIESTDTLNVALGKIQKQIDVADTRVDDLDYTAEAAGNAADGVVTVVTQTNGQIAVTKADPLTTMGYADKEDAAELAADQPDGQYVLTKKVTAGVPSYSWELITRAE